MRLQHKFIEEARGKRLFAPGGRLYVSVSGGVDSMVLLHLLHTLAGWHKMNLRVLTFDHNMRKDSARDVEHVRGFCQTLGLQCEVEVAQAQLRSEADARAFRQQHYANRSDATIALAHHRDDLAEGFLLAAIRGAGSQGLANLRPRRGALIRPLLWATKNQLYAWAKAHDVPFREDETNQSKEFLRNRVRHEVLPLLEQIRPGATGSLAASATRCAEDAEVISADAAALPWDVQALKQALPSVAVRKILMRFPDISFGEARELLERMRENQSLSAPWCILEGALCRDA